MQRTRCKEWQALRVTDSFAASSMIFCQRCRGIVRNARLHLMDSLSRRPEIPTTHGNIPTFRPLSSTPATSPGVVRKCAVSVRALQRVAPRTHSSVYTSQPGRSSKATVTRVPGLVASDRRKPSRHGDLEGFAPMLPCRQQTQGLVTEESFRAVSSGLEGTCASDGVLPCWPLEIAGMHRDSQISDKMG